MADNYTK